MVVDNKYGEVSHSIPIMLDEIFVDFYYRVNDFPAVLGQAVPFNVGR